MQFQANVFTTEQIQAQLIWAFDEVAGSPDKRVYQTSGGIRALTRIEARTDQSAHLINPSNRRQALKLIMTGLNIQKSANNSREQISQTFAMILQAQPPSQIDRERLKYTAEVEGFGYKEANLDQVDELCDQDYGAYHLKVPIYAGISSAALQTLLKRQCGLDVTNRWNAIIDTHFPQDRPEIREQTLRSKKFPEGFFADCATLRQELKTAFSLLIAQMQDDDDLDALFGTSDINALLTQLHRQNERLMVRSTGKAEDTAELANAGGNTSVSNVLSTPREVMTAIDDVFTSYFGEKSLKQRLGANDRSLFEPNPLTPVLLQRMIGEKHPNAMPLCGVMFTEDPESKTLNTLGATESTGNTVVQAAFGHNEAVVNSLIPVDTHYISNDGVIFSIVRPKTHRMVPTERSGELELRANDAVKANSACLSRPMIDTLKAFGQRLEQFYGQSMDVEFVIDETDRTIYIVQARPIVHRLDTAPASYIAEPKKLESGKVLKGSAIGAAGGGVRLARSSQVLTASTISQALDKYQELEDPSAIQAVVVGKMAPSTSHWATIFRNEGKPVLFIDQLQTMESWLQDPEAHFMMSPQQGLIENLGNAAPTLQELLANGTCVLGWIDYPAADLISLCSQFQPTERLTDEAIFDICPALRDADRWSRFQKNASRVNLLEVFEKLRNAQGDELNLALAMLLFAFKRTLDDRGEGPVRDADQARRAEAMKGQALALVRSVKENGKFPPNHALYSRKLLPIHFLKALIYAQPQTSEVVDGDSLALDLREIRDEQAIIQQLQAEGITLNNPYSPILLRLERFALTPEIANVYRDHILSLDSAGRGDELMYFAQLVHQMNNLDLVSWLNLVFPHHPSVAAQIGTFNKHASLYKNLSEKREILNALNISAFATKKGFETQWRALNNSLLSYVTSEEFAKEYQNADIAGKLAMLSFMRQFVDKFDLSIKALEGSSPEEFSVDEKLRCFQRMLGAYYRLALEWSNQFPLSEDRKNKISRCLSDIHRALSKKELSKDDLQFSKYFDLIAFGSVSGASKGRVMNPVTLEDTFSGLHQELLTMLNLLTQGVSGASIPLPPLLHHVTEQLELGSRTGVEITARGVTTHYSKTLREHGVQYAVNQRMGGDEVTLTVRFSAQNEGHRWERIAHFMLLLKFAGKFDVTDMELGTRGVGYTFHLDGNDQLPVLRGILLDIEMFSNQAPYAGAEVPLISNIDNSKKGLVATTDNRRIVDEFERLCGIESMLSNQQLVRRLKKVMLNDVTYAAAFLQRAWRTNLNLVAAPVVNNALPVMLVESGYITPEISQRAKYLMHTTEEQDRSSGIALLCAIARQEATALPTGCVWEMLCVLVDPWKQFIHSDVDFILVSLGQLDRPRDSIQDKLISALLDKKRKTRDLGIKILDVLVKKYPEYLTPELREALRKSAMDPLMDPTTKAALLTWV